MLGLANFKQKGLVWQGLTCNVRVITVWMKCLTKMFGLASFKLKSWVWQGGPEFLALTRFDLIRKRIDLIIWYDKVSTKMFGSATIERKYLFCLINPS